MQLLRPVTKPSQTSGTQPGGRASHTLPGLIWITITTFCWIVLATQGAEIKAARSVHWGWTAPAGGLFYNEMVVQQSTRGSYFMACGWNTGYFGIQELGDGRKIALFSVWDPTKGDDAASVPLEQRVEVLHQDPAVQIRRFGGEGTGGQCKLPFDWKLGETNRFIVKGRVEGSKTAYDGYLFIPLEGKWKHLVTFRTRTGGSPLKGYYSFVEDFRRDGRSVQETRKSWFGNGWVRTITGEWHRIAQARFTASSAEWESKDNISSGIENGGLFLATGGEISTNFPLRTVISIPESKVPPPVLAPGM